MVCLARCMMHRAHDAMDPRSGSDHHAVAAWWPRPPMVVAVAAVELLLLFHLGHCFQWRRSAGCLGHDANLRNGLGLAALAPRSRTATYSSGKLLHGARRPCHPYGCALNLQFGFAEFGWVMSRFGCAAAWFPIMGGVDCPRGGYLFNLSSRIIHRRPHSMPTGGSATSPSHCGEKPRGGARGRGQGNVPVARAGAHSRPGLFWLWH